MRTTTAAVLTLLCACLGCQSTSKAPAPAAAPAKATFTTPARTATPGSGLDLADMDLHAAPAKDFYRYVNGGWLDRYPVPADEALWGVFNEVKARNEVVLKQVLEDAAAHPSDDLQRKLGDFYVTGMDEAAIEAQGVKPLAEEFAAIEACTDLQGLPALLARLHAEGVGAFFSARATADLTDATMNILFISQAGTGLPEKDYYLRTDAATVELRAKYAEHIAHLFGMLGESPPDAALQAARILEFETELATAGFGALDFRDPKKLLNKITLSDAQALTPHFDWSLYLTACGVSAPQNVNVVAPNYFKALDALLASHSLDQLHTYLRWQLIHEYADALSKAFDEENFAFFGRTLGGAAEQRPRWKRVMDASGGAMGEILSQGFVARSFTPEAKRRCQKMVDDLIAAFRVRIEKLTWMGETTRAKALEKLAAFRSKIGYPDKWRDWSGLVVARDSFVKNQQRASQFGRAWNLGKVGKPVDRDEFGMPAYIVNASYSPSKNDITFPAGILQPPFFSATYDDALNYGAMGAVIGHELTHGFDDSGSQFDGQGNLANWWTDTDRTEFERRAQIVVDQFSGYVAIDDLHVNGKLTLGENLADLGGLTIAYDALQRALANQKPALIDGFTPSQRFFIAWSRAWRTNYTPARLKLQVNTNPHSPGRFRALGPLSNLDVFRDAFSFADDAPVMRPAATRAVVW